MGKAEIREKIQAAKDGGRTGEIVMTETGEFLHLQGSWTKTMCGKDIDRDREQPDDTFYCMTCQKNSSKRF